MPISPPRITAQDIRALRYQVNEAISWITKYLETLMGIDGRTPTFYNDVTLNQKKITSLAPATDPSDAMTYSQMTTFRTIACPAGTNPVADSAGDTLTLAAGANRISITGNAATDTVTITIVDSPQLVDVVLTSAGALYLGATGTDGTWRIIRDGDNLVFQRREAGSYVTKHTTTP